MQFDWLKNIRQGRKYYLACSGGVDSMVALFLLAKSQVDVEVLHVNYQLRGEDSFQDEALVVSYANNLGFKVHVHRIDTKKELPKGENLQAFCRDIRYSWFDTFLQQDSSSVLVVAHHQDDQLETFYLQLARKAGIQGLSSLKSDQNRIIRPLLNFKKSELYTFAKRHEIPWREDVSNAKSDYARNKLRNDILPSLEQEIPTLRVSVITMIDLFQEESERLKSEIHSEILLSNSFELKLNIWNNWSMDKRYLFINELGILSTIYIEIDKLTHSEIGKFIELDKWIISKQQDKLCFDRAIIESKKLIIQAAQHLPTDFDKTSIYLDEAKIQGELKLRKWQKGDRIAAIGVAGSKLVSKVLNEAKLSVYQKRNALVVADDEHIHWVVGVKIGRFAVATSLTQKILKLTVQ